jgi:hypothetical protein
LVLHSVLWFDGLPGGGLVREAGRGVRNLQPKLLSTMSKDDSLQGMNRPVLRALWAEPYGTPSLIRRLLVEYGSRHWLSYAVTFLLMGTAAACTAFAAYLIGHVVNKTHLSHDFGAIIALSVLTIVIFTVKGFASTAKPCCWRRSATK